MDPTSPIPVSSESARPPAQAEHRRGTRLSVAVPVILAGKDMEGKKFREESRTLSINRTGATLETAHIIVPGAELLIKNPSLGITVRARAVRLTRRASQLSLLAVELLDLKNVWGIRYPPQDCRLPPPVAAKHEKAPASAAPPKVIEIDLTGPLTASSADNGPFGPELNPKETIKQPEEEHQTISSVETELAGLIQRAMDFCARFESLLRQSPVSGEEQIALAAQDMMEKFTSQIGEADRRIRAARRIQPTETLRPIRRPPHDAAKAIPRKP